MSSHERAHVGGKRSQPFDYAKARELGHQRFVQLGELVPALQGPVVVPVLGQERSPVDGNGSPVGRRRSGPTSLDRCSLETNDVDVRLQLEQPVAPLDHVAAEGAACHVHRLVQVVRGCSRFKIAPEDIHDLLGVQALARGERQELHKLACLLQPPCVVGYGLAVHVSREAAKEPDRGLGHLFTLAPR